LQHGDLIGRRATDEVRKGTRVKVTPAAAMSRGSGQQPPHHFAAEHLVVLGCCVVQQ
jgi:hypothetical protein